MASRRCLRQAAESISGLIWPWPLTSWPRGWAFILLARGSFCAKWHQNTVYTSLVRWMDTENRRTDRLNTLCLPPLAWQGHKMGPNSPGLVHMYPNINKVVCSKQHLLVHEAQNWMTRSFKLSTSASRARCLKPQSQIRLQNKKLSYCKHIARQLRTQYIEGIYSNSVTLKPGLEVTQRHWNGTIR